MTAPARERFADNDGVRIRYLDSGHLDGGERAPAAGLPVLFVPGITDFADEYLAMFELFQPRRLLVVEMRGRGGSDAPDKGYSAAEQAGDLEAVLAATALSKFHLMTFSRGTTPALELALAAPERVATLAIGDYRAAEIALPAAFVGRQWASRWRGRPMPDRIRRHVLDEIQRQSADRSLWAEVGGLGIPVLVAGGGEGSLVTAEVIEAYRRHVPGVEILQIPEAGHDLFRPDRLAYPRAVLDFIARRAPGV